MTKVNLKCIDVSGNGRHFTIGKLYGDVWIDAKAKKVSIANDKGQHNSTGYKLNSEKELQAQGCAFKIALVSGVGYDNRD